MSHVPNETKWYHFWHLEKMHDFIVVFFSEKTSLRPVEHTMSDIHRRLDRIEDRLDDILRLLRENRLPPMRRVGPYRKNYTENRQQRRYVPYGRMPPLPPRRSLPQRLPSSPIHHPATPPREEGEL